MDKLTIANDGCGSQSLTVAATPTQPFLENSDFVASAVLIAYENENRE